MHTCVYLLRVHMTKNTYMYKIHICKCKNTPGLSRCIFARGCIFAHVQINFYIYAIAFTCPKIHPGANYTYMYNLHTVCKSAHVNGALVIFHLHQGIVLYCVRQKLTFAHEATLHGQKDVKNVQYLRLHDGCGTGLEKSLIGTVIYRLMWLNMKIRIQL